MEKKIIPNVKIFKIYPECFLDKSKAVVKTPRP